MIKARRSLLALRKVRAFKTKDENLWSRVGVTSARKKSRLKLAKRQVDETAPNLIQITWHWTLNTRFLIWQ